MKQSDEAQLDWYFGSGRLVLGGSSSFGYQLEHAQMYHVEGPHVPKDQVTAWPTKQPMREAGFTPDDESMWRSGWLSKRLKELAEVDPLAVQILEAYWGDEGAVYARSKHTRAASLVKFTKTGQRMLREAQGRERAQAPVKACASVGSELAVMTEKATMMRALCEARALYEYACEAWQGHSVPVAVAAE